MTDQQIHLCDIHTQPNIQPSVIVLHDEMCAEGGTEWNKKCEKEGEFLGSVLFHALPEATRFHMSKMIRRLEEL